jgi:hypothetical protein
VDHVHDRFGALMARALQCPDCGHREPLDNVVDIEQFRCHGCGRALKVPPELRTNGADPIAPEGATTQLRPEIAREPAPDPAPGTAQEPIPAPTPEPTRILARVSGDEILPGSATPPMPTAPGLTRAEREALAAEVYAQPISLVLRLAVWTLWLPVGLGFTFWFAIKVEWLNRDHLVDTLGKVTWDRFVPIARLLPLAALIVALLVHATILLLERWVGRRRLRSARASQLSAESR